MAIRWIEARFDSKCKGCGEQMYEGDRIAYDAEERAAYCEDCGEIEEERQAAQSLRHGHRRQYDDIDDFEDC